MSGWKPIETAPKTAPILVYTIDGGIDVVWWQRDFLDGSEYWQNEAYDDPQPTHWMPLPAPPREAMP